MRDDALRLLEDLVSRRPGPPAGPRFQEATGAMFEVIRVPLDARAVALLLAVLRVRGELPFADDSHFPGSLSPEEMLKSLAVQALVRWTGLTHLHEVRLAEETASPGLRSIIRNVVRRAQTPTGSAGPG